MVVHCAVTQVILCSVSTTERERNLKPGNFPSVYPPVLVTKSTKWKHWPSTGFLGQSARHQTNSMKSDIKLMHRDHQELSKIPVLERIIEGIGGISPDTTAWFKGVAPGCTVCEVWSCIESWIQHRWMVCVLRLRCSPQWPQSIWNLLYTFLTTIFNHAVLCLYAHPCPNRKTNLTSWCSVLCRER